jgi:hypothetical protein
MALSPHVPGTGCWFECGSTDAADLHGQLLVPATEIPGVGRFAVFTDPSGAAPAAIRRTA